MNYEVLLKAGRTTHDAKRRILDANTYARGERTPEVLALSERAYQIVQEIIHINRSFFEQEVIPLLTNAELTVEDGEKLFEESLELLVLLYLRLERNGILPPLEDSDGSQLFDLAVGHATDFLHTLREAQRHGYPPSKTQKLLTSTFRQLPYTLRRLANKYDFPESFIFDLVWRSRRNPVPVIEQTLQKTDSYMEKFPQFGRFTILNTVYRHDDPEAVLLWYQEQANLLSAKFPQFSPTQIIKAIREHPRETESLLEKAAEKLPLLVDRYPEVPKSTIQFALLSTKNPEAFLTEYLNKLHTLRAEFADFPEWILKVALSHQSENPENFLQLARKQRETFSERYPNFPLHVFYRALISEANRPLDRVEAIYQAFNELQLAYPHLNRSFLLKVSERKPGTALEYMEEQTPLVHKLTETSNISEYLVRLLIFNHGTDAIAERVQKFIELQQMLRVDFPEFEKVIDEVLLSYWENTAQKFALLRQQWEKEKTQSANPKWDRFLQDNLGNIFAQNSAVPYSSDQLQD